MHSKVLIITKREEIDKYIDADSKFINYMTESAFSKFYRNMVHTQPSIFETAVNMFVDDMMDPYDCNTTDPKYLEFDDHTDELIWEFNNCTCTVMRSPNGIDHICRFIGNGECIAHDGLKAYIVVGDKAYFTSSYYAYNSKTTKMSRKMKVRKVLIKDYFGSFDSYVKLTDMVRNEDGKYGYYYNPQGIYNYYTIYYHTYGFLVDKSCNDVVEVRHKNLYSTFLASKDFAFIDPESHGLKWVTVARKKDIKWDEMDKYHLSTIFKNIKLYYQTKDHPIALPKNWILREDDVVNVKTGEVIWYDGMSFEEFVEGRKPMPYRFSYVIDNINGGGLKDGTSDAYEEYIKDLDDEDIIISLDIHM